MSTLCLHPLLWKSTNIYTNHGFWMFLRCVWSASMACFHVTFWARWCHGDVKHNSFPKIEKYPPNGHRSSTKPRFLRVFKFWAEGIRSSPGWFTHLTRRFSGALELKPRHFVQRWKAMIQAPTSCIVPVGLLGQLLASTQPACSEIRLVAGHNCCVSEMLSTGWISPHFCNGLDFWFSGVTVW